MPSLRHSSAIEHLPQALQNDTDFLFGGELTASLSADLLNGLFCVGHARALTARSSDLLYGRITEANSSALVAATNFSANEGHCRHKNLFEFRYIKIVVQQI